jgi:hypothetical protein
MVFSQVDPGHLDNFFLLKAINRFIGQSLLR